MENKEIKKWKQEGNRLLFKRDKLESYFDMPDGWKLENTHETILKLAEFVIINSLGDYKYKMCEILKWKKRKYGTRTGLSFSGGADSTAAMCLLPEDTILYYHKRSEDNYEGIMDQSNQLYMMENIDRKVYVIESNHENIRTYFGKNIGFTTDYACMVGLILMADFLDLKNVATGTMLGSTYVYKGYYYIDYLKSDKCERWKKIFNQAGLNLIMPVACCSEVITNEITQKSKYKNLSYSCLRGEFGKTCNYCYKCFRKNLLNGVESNYSGEVMRNINTKPIHQGDALIYGANKYGLDNPILNEFNYLDMSWMEKYYGKALKLVPKDMVKGIIEKLKHYGIEEMDEEDIEKMKEYNIGYSEEEGV